MKTAHYILFLVFGSFSCHESPSFTLKELYRQRIPNSPKVIYQFMYSNHWELGGDWKGKTIMDSTQAFPQELATRKDLDELPQGFITGRINAQRLSMDVLDRGTATPSDTLLTPSRRYSNKFKDIDLDLADYRQTYGGGTHTGFQEYNFLSVAETPDSLIFYGVARKYGKPLPERAAFAKGNITLVGPADSAIVHFIEIRELVRERDDMYMPGKPLELVHDRPIVDERVNDFYPMTTLLSSRFTDFGVYKRIK